MRRALFSALLLSAFFNASAETEPKLTVEVFESHYLLSCEIYAGEGVEIETDLIESCEKEAKDKLTQIIKERSTEFANYELGDEVFVMDVFKDVVSYDNLVLNRKIELVAN